MDKVIRFNNMAEFHGLVDELVQSVIEFQQLEGEFRIKFKYQLASTIVNHPAYQKWGKQNQDFIIRLASEVRKQLSQKSGQKISKTSLYDAIQVYEAYPSEKKLLEALAEKHEPVFWSAALRLIGREDSKLGKHCPPHICKFCGKKL